MKGCFLLPLLYAIFGTLQLVHAQCDISTGKLDVDFPDIEQEGIESYMMSVEYTLPGPQQTDYYTEYYDILNRRGRVDSHQKGNNRKYIYKTGKWESWDIRTTQRECKSKNDSYIPEMFSDDQSEWLYKPTDNVERTTVGPSAMFKTALDEWKKKDKKMAYMGEFEGDVRGLKANYWRRCNTETSYVDYYFATVADNNELGMKIKNIPLRVVFSGKRKGEDKDLSNQQYEILSFQPFISPDLDPFQLPRGFGCKRFDLTDVPKIPDFSKQNLMFYAEVIYRKIDFSGADAEYYSYYSTLRMALDLSSNFLAYTYSPWNSSKPETTPEPFTDPPQNVIFDMKHGFEYKIDDGTGECTITREKSYTPEYKLPGDAGSISLTDPSILFPNSEFTYLGDGKNRGLQVNVFEEVVQDYILNKKNGQIKIPKAVVSHTYLKDNEVEINQANVRNSLSQVQLFLSGRYEKVIEIVTFNFFGFSTEIRNKRWIFNLRRCFRNDDDYVWVTLGFDADKSKLEEIQDQIPRIQSNILNSITLRSELNAVRIPVIMVDISDSLYVTLMILGRPPILLDYLDPEKNKTITGSQDVEGVTTAEACGAKCLESEDNCWGFAICGGLCNFGAGKGAKVTSKNNCTLYRRFNNDTYIPTTQAMVEDIRSQVRTFQVNIVLQLKDGNMTTLQATSIEVNDPGEDDRMFRRLGNVVNPRMRAFKAGYKVKKESGVPVKNLGQLRYDECQSLCLDYKDCETVSYCMVDSSCVLSVKHAEDLDKEEYREDNMCIILTRKYIDHFSRSPGIILGTSARKQVDKKTAEECARACLDTTDFTCLSFDHCQTDQFACRLHEVHSPGPKQDREFKTNSSSCGHYSRDFSTEYRKSPGKRLIGSKIPSLTGLTVAQCAKICMEFQNGTCYGYDFCQGNTVFETSCTLFDTDPSKLKSTDSDSCTNYLRIPGKPQPPTKEPPTKKPPPSGLPPSELPPSELPPSGQPPTKFPREEKVKIIPRPYSNSYAGGIGFLCFIVGVALGVGVVFTVAYIRMNRR